MTGTRTSGFGIFHQASRFSGLRFVPSYRQPSAVVSPAHVKEVGAIVETSERLEMKTQEEP